MKRFIAATVAALSLNLAFAVESEGAKFDDTVKVGGVDLVVNGLGVRSKFGKRYVAALYLASKSSDADAVVASKGPKRVTLHLLKDGDGKTFAKAFVGGIEDNSSELEMAAIKDRLGVFSTMMQSMGDVKAGSVVVIDWIPEKGTHVSVNNKPLGKEIAGEDFFRALLKVWLGKSPVQNDLKAGLLGKP
ncbi:chalcone isomerase family protein [Rhodoferax sp.]|uniref:chalcone isomerase family protein n=1 Tax=Rhodoferax sp. TaxID=50421 RepID=UPI0027511573|nr:chalcone isomerase family protein [Rhodoferax sp.]